MMIRVFLHTLPVTILLGSFVGHAGAKVLFDWKADAKHGDRFSFRLSTGGSLGGSTSSAPFSPGQWTHLIGVFDGKMTQLYVDGTLASSQPVSGKVDGTDPYRLRGSSRARFRAEKIGMVFQDFRLLPYLDVRRNVLAPTLAVPGPNHGARADALIEELGLTPRRHHLPKELSAGEQQRTALARALLTAPSVLLADEPTGNLDEENSGHVLDQTRAFARDGGTVLAATHDPAVAAVAAAADRCLRLENGCLVSS